MKNISFFLTERQFRSGRKDVTRRLGWKDLEPGTYLSGVRKGQGLRPGEKLERLGLIQVLRVTREKLNAITLLDVKREGFPGMTEREFVQMFCRHMGCKPSTIVTRIEFRKMKPVPRNE